MTENGFLKDLVLLRNDPATVLRAREAAARGEVDAFYALGLIYAEGRGVKVDLAQAHYWLSLAIDQGDKDAELLRNIVGSLAAVGGTAFLSDGRPAKPNRIFLTSLPILLKYNGFFSLHQSTINKHI